jgi:hypothetical protein
MTEAWRQAVDEHVALVQSWSSVNGSYLNGLMLWASRTTEADMAMYRAADGDVDLLDAVSPLRKPTDDDRRKGAADVAAEQSRLIVEAVTWAVTGDMVALVNHASESMPFETVERFDVPCPNGFVYLEEPAFSRTGSGPGYNPAGLKVPHRAFHWYEVPGGLNVVTYKGREDFVEGEERPSSDDMRILPRLRVGVEFDWLFGGPDWSEYSVAKWLKALWTISGQRISEVSDSRPDRSRLRRAQRVGLLEDSKVRVVSLRRPEHTPRDGTGAHVDWSHRWIVSGHWRNQWRPSVRQHRLQWIDDHVKGPDDKPLVVKPPVMHVHR